MLTHSKRSITDRVTENPKWNQSIIPLITSINYLYCFKVIKDNKWLAWNETPCTYIWLNELIATLDSHAKNDCCNVPYHLLKIVHFISGHSVYVGKPKQSYIKYYIKEVSCKNERRNIHFNNKIYSNKNEKFKK